MKDLFLEDSGTVNLQQPHMQGIVLSLIIDTGTWIGGMFWDGRATGWTLGDPLAEQAKGPFLNPMEQGLPDAACVVYRVVTSDYRDLYQQVWGKLNIQWPKKVCSEAAKLSDGDQTKVDAAYNNIARSIAAYERSKEVSSFTSKYDDYLKGKASADITGNEWT